MSKLPKFEIELPAAPKSTKLSLSEREHCHGNNVCLSFGRLLPMKIVFSAVMIGGCCKHTRAALAPASLGTQEKGPPSPLPESYECRKLLIFQTFFSDLIDFVILQKIFSPH